MKSGVTTALVKADNLCGNVIEVTPQQGLGQSYLPTKAAFQWQAATGGWGSSRGCRRPRHPP